jgi:signal transduction histidine kinase
MAAGQPRTKFQVDLQSKEGRRLTLEVNARLILRDGAPFGIQAIARDITGRDIAEMELRQAQKLESVGRLASGIAHEINTPMQFVGDNVRFLQDAFGDLRAFFASLSERCDRVAAGSPSPAFVADFRRLTQQIDLDYLLREIPEALAQTQDGVERVVTIVRAMKEFAHPDSRGMARADINKALLNTLTVARNELKYVAEVETDFGQLPLVVCSVSDMNQVFLNLLVNAAHAIGDVVRGTEQKGKIRVHTEKEGAMAMIAISDTGAGIPESIRERIFDPFFTTKEVGRGTGQGLAIARSVVDRHKGTLTFESAVGRGTTFFIRLPIESAETQRVS